MLFKPRAEVSIVIATLIEIRRAWRVSLEVVAERAHVSGRNLSAIERGRRSPSLRTLEKWADALGYEIVLRPKPAERS